MKRSFWLVDSRGVKVKGINGHRVRLLFVCSGVGSGRSGSRGRGRGSGGAMIDREPIGVRMRPALRLTGAK